MVNKNRVNFRENRICQHCGCEFTARKSNQVYCSFNCYRKLTLKLERVCVQCGGKLPINKQKYCSYQCESLYLKRRKINTYNVNLSRTTIGVATELKVASELFLKGYSVFRALSPSAPCDLIAIKDKHIFRIEVRTVNYYTKNTDFTKRIKDTDDTDYWAFVTPQMVYYYPSDL